MTDPQPRRDRHPAVHHSLSLMKGAAHHVGALLLMTLLRGVLLTAIGAGGLTALSTFLPHELQPATEHAMTAPGVESTPGTAR